MKSKLMMLNHGVLFLCASAYLGTGVSLVFFTFPTTPEWTPDNYKLQFVSQIAAATELFTNITRVMLACGAIMLIAEWRS